MKTFFRPRDREVRKKMAKLGIQAWMEKRSGGFDRNAVGYEQVSVPYTTIFYGLRLANGEDVDCGTKKKDINNVLNGYTAAMDHLDNGKSFQSIPANCLCACC